MNFDFLLAIFIVIAFAATIGIFIVQPAIELDTQTNKQNKNVIYISLIILIVGIYFAINMHTSIFTKDTPQDTTQDVIFLANRTSDQPAYIIDGDCAIFMISQNESITFKKIKLEDICIKYIVYEDGVELIQKQNNNTYDVYLYK